MFSLRPELRAEEVETILKLTAKSIDHIQANVPFKGHYGAGMLQSGAALDLVSTLYDAEGVSVLKDQKFSRWRQKLTAYNRVVILKDIQFKEQSEFTLRAKKQIILKPGTLLAPENNQGIKLSIDPSLTLRP
jgi:hypothetical protein